MPSLYEGFGMTALEAFATKAPAILGKIPTLEEVAGDAAYFVDPKSTEEIVEAIGKFAHDENLRESYRQKGIERVKGFDWDKTARETLEIYRQVAGK